MEIGIIGGGMMGLVTAFYLAKAGLPVTVLEKEEEIGGLSRPEEIMPGLRWDRYYHVILSTDTQLLSFLDEIGLSPQVNFKETKTGFYTDGRLHSMSNTMEFLRFKPISLWDKFRLGAGVLYATNLSNSHYLENTNAKVWLTKVFGEANYEKLWGPLLRSKLGMASDQASASFIWACINRLYGTRKRGSKKEMLGCVRGGYYSILSRLQENLRKNGVRILVNHEVEKLESIANGKIRLHCSGGNAFDFDRVVSTVPNPQVLHFWEDISDGYRTRLKKVRYLNLICATLVLKKSLSPYYVTNLTDSGFPFTGLIEATHVISREVLGEKGLIYLPRYMAPNDPFGENTDERVMEIFFDSLKRIFPDFSDKDVITRIVHRDSNVQPIQEVNYSLNIPSMETPLKNFYLVNTTMILNSTLNNNQVVVLARKMAELLLKNLR
jgi:protoporphyrinogen oxidase